jgi:hypothetical protein
MFNYGTMDDAAAAAGRFAGSGVPAGATDLTTNLDPVLGDALSYAITTDLSGTPAEQVVSIFASGNWLFRYYSLTPQVAAAILPHGGDTPAFPYGSRTVVASPGHPRGRLALPLAIGEEVADESAALVAAALTFNAPELIRELLRDKGYADEEINTFVNDLFPTRFADSTATRVDYVKHNARDYVPFTGTDADNELQRGYYADAMCAFADDGPIPPTNTNYYYAVKRFFPDAGAAGAFFDAQPTTAMQASHSANNVTFQDDPDASTPGVRSSYISWQPPGATSTFPGFGFSRLRGPIVSHFNVYNVNPPPDGPTTIDPGDPLYQSLRTGVLDILGQQDRFDANPAGWPVYETPGTFVG